MPSKNRTHLLSFVSLIGLAVIAAAPASAQRMGNPSSVTGGGNTVLPSLERTNPQMFYQEAVKALQAKDFRGAAAALKEAMKEDPRNPTFNYLMGLSQIGLNDLDVARRHLRIAASGKNAAPEPKGRLGWVETRLGDAKAASRQREDLVKMQAACSGSCPEAAAISEAIAIIDSARPAEGSGG
jgi:predicted Zn-dependent protease